MKRCPHGRGVFTLKSYRKGDLITVLSNQIFTESTDSKGYALRISENLYWDEDPKNPNDWTKYLDHSSTPNVHLTFKPSEKTVLLKAIRDIEAGEELLIDYTEYYPVNYPSNPWSVEQG